MEKKMNEMNRFLHHTFALMGGFTGAYVIFIRANVFANAQTMNLFNLVYAIIGKDAKEVLLRILALVVYAFAIILSTVLKHKTKINLVITALVVNLCMFVLEAFIPMDIHPVLMVLPVFFAMPFQWCAMSGSYGYNSSTIFSSNNTRQTTIAITEYVLTHDRKKLQKAIFYAGSLLSFYVGAAVCVLLSDYWGKMTSVFGIAFIFPAILLLFYEKRLKLSQVLI